MNTCFNALSKLKLVLITFLLNICNIKWPKVDIFFVSISMSCENLWFYCTYAKKNVNGQ